MFHVSWVRGSWVMVPGFVDAHGSWLMVFGSVLMGVMAHGSWLMAHGLTRSVDRIPIWEPPTARSFLGHEHEP